jgi:hypothetical protein
MHDNPREYQLRALPTKQETPMNSAATFEVMADWRGRVRTMDYERYNRGVGRKSRLVEGDWRRGTTTGIIRFEVVIYVTWSLLKLRRGSYRDHLKGSK